MDKCPECDGLLGAEATKCRCGWTQFPKVAPGEFSPAYHRYFPKQEPQPELTPAQKERAEQFIARIRKMLSQPKPHPRAWAQKILDRVKEGERLPQYVVQCALEVAGDAPAPLPLREPGQD